MNFRLFFLMSNFLLITTSLFCQNWQPISTTGQTNYRVSPSPSISAYLEKAPEPPYSTPGALTPFVTIKTTSFSAMLSDTLFYFNLWTYSKGDTIYPDRAPFLEMEMFKTSNGIYHFYNPDTFYINTQAALNESWLFRPGTQDSAIVADIIEGTVLGQLDSMKIIHLTTGDSIILSKNFGIVHFSDTSDVFYDLKGIEFSLNNYVGLRLPNSYEVYNYEIGDQLIIRYVDGYSHPFNANWTNTSIKKYTITSKQTTPTGYTYNVDYDLWNRQWVDGFQDDTLISVGYSGTWTHEENSATDFRINSDNGNRNPGWTIVYEDSIGRLYKTTIDYLLVTSLGNNVHTYYKGALYEDIIRYSSTLGIIHRYYYTSSPSQYSSLNLIGYVKNGVAYGDTTLLSRPGTVVSSVEPLSNLSMITIYPQPAEDFININFEKQLNSTVEVELIDMQGVLRKSWLLEPSSSYSLDINELSSGTYIVKVVCDSAQFTQKILISE